MAVPTSTAFRHFYQIYKTNYSECYSPVREEKKEVFVDQLIEQYRTIPSGSQGTVSYALGLRTLSFSFTERAYSCSDALDLLKDQDKSELNKLRKVHNFTVCHPHFFMKRCTTCEEDLSLEESLGILKFINVLERLNNSSRRFHRENDS